MSRLLPYLGTALAVLVGCFIFLFANDVTVLLAPSPSPKTASSTLLVLPNLSLPATLFPTIEPQEESSSTLVTQNIASEEKITKVPEKVAKASPVKAATSTPPVSAPVSAPVVTPAPPIPSSGDESLDTVASKLRNALVNIICYAPAGSSTLHSISGSGIFIDSKGIVLTNAHIAQYFLLLDRSVSCTLRVGSPASDAYKAELIYISPAWIHANAQVLSQAQPIGTGEYDFALLAVTKSVNATPLPTAFPFVPLAQNPPVKGTPVVIASFGAQFLESTQIQSSLFPTIVFGSVKEVYTFVTNTIDILALGGSAAAQEGSSGGGVADASGSLVGTITTSTVEGATETRSLDAITASYIRSQYSREMGGSSIDTMLTEPTSVAIADFATKIKALESVLTAQLQ